MVLVWLGAAECCVDVFAWLGAEDACAGALACGAGALCAAGALVLCCAKANAGISNNNPSQKYFRRPFSFLLKFIVYS
jgi:hypothetical protein